MAQYRRDLVVVLVLINRRSHILRSIGAYGASSRRIDEQASLAEGRLTNIMRRLVSIGKHHFYHPGVATIAGDERMALCMASGLVTIVSGPIFDDARETSTT